MKYPVMMSSLAAATGLAALLMSGAPAHAATLTYTYDVQLEFTHDHVRQLFREDPDDPDIVIGVVTFEDDDYPWDWRPPYGFSSDLAIGETLSLIFSIEVPANPADASQHITLTSCTWDGGQCSRLGHDSVTAFDPASGKVRMLGDWSGSSAKTVDLFSGTARFVSELGWSHPFDPDTERSYTFCFPREYAPYGFCGYWDYEAHFKIKSFNVQGPLVIPVPPALPLLASALLGLAALRRKLVRRRAA